MPQADTSIPLPSAPDSRVATFQALAERVGLLVPGASLSPQQVDFANAIVALVEQGDIGGAPETEDDDARR